MNIGRWSDIQYWKIPDKDDGVKLVQIWSSSDDYQEISLIEEYMGSNLGFA